MKTYIRAITLLLITAMMILSFIGCNQPTTGKSSESSTITDNSSDSSAVEESSQDSGESMVESTDSSTDTSTDTSTDSSTTSSTTDSSSTVSPTSTASSSLTEEQIQNLYPGRVKNLNGRTVRINYPVAPKEGSTDVLVKAITTIAKNIETKLNCKLVFDTHANESAAYTAITASVMAGKPSVDIWWANGFSEFLNHYVAGLIQPLDPLRVFDFNDENLFMDTSSIAMVGGKRYALGVGDNVPAASEVLFFNKKILTDAGVNDDLFALQRSGNWTWAKFAEICDKVNAAALMNVDVPVIGFKDNGSALYHALLWTYGTDSLIKTSGGAIQFNTSSTQTTVLSYYKNLAAGGTIIVPDLSAGGKPEENIMQDGFIYGNAAFGFAPYLYSYFGINNYGTQSVKDNWGAVMLPKKSASDAYTYISNVTSTTLMTIPYGVKKPAEVATVLAMFFDPATAGDDYITFEKAKQVFNQSYLPSLNEATGDGTLETIDMLFNYMKGTKRTYSYHLLGQGPGISKSWMGHVSKIANGTEAAGSVIASVSGGYNTLLQDLFKVR